MGNIYLVGELHPCNHKVIENTNIKTAFKRTNTTGNILEKTPTTIKHKHAGIYTLTCLDYQKSYIGQTNVP
jgi:hypothetical protein